jgi:hypothetical protein
MPATNTFDLRSHTSPEIEFSVPAGIYQWLVSDQQSHANVNGCRKPREQHKADDSDSANRAKPKIESIGYSGTHTENPASIAVTIEPS